LFQLFVSKKTKTPDWPKGHGIELQHFA